MRVAGATKRVAAACQSTAAPARTPLRAAVTCISSVRAQQQQQRQCDELPATSSRRAALLAGGAALLGGACGWPSQAAAAAASDVASLTAAEMYSQFPYITPADILPYIRASAAPGDVEGVLAAIDHFAQFYPMYRCGPEKGAILERLVSEQRPSVALELGTFMGYGTARIFRSLPPGGRVISVEAGEEQAAVARQVLAYAGLPVGEGPDARVQVINGLSGDVLPRLRELAGLPPGGSTQGEQQEGAASAPPPVPFVFLDHCKTCYLPDLLTLERLGLVSAGSLVAADNVIFPKPLTDYLLHVGAPAAALPMFSSAAADVDADAAVAPGSRGGKKKKSRDAEGGFAYQTELIEAAFELEERYRADYSGPRKDAMAASLCVAAP